MRNDLTGEEQMGFWENFWLFVPPIALVIGGFVFFFKTRPAQPTPERDRPDSDVSR
ncbi:MAG: hypothetical protein ACE5GA_00755 [Candidatus Zixiibacteriota bacterium]